LTETNQKARQPAANPTIPAKTVSIRLTTKPKEEVNRKARYVQRKETGITSKLRKIRSTLLVHLPFFLKKRPLLFYARLEGRSFL
jgi:hypothetical protein